jgi:hypothetical protein
MAVALERPLIAIKRRLHFRTGEAQHATDSLHRATIWTENHSAPAPSGVIVEGNSIYFPPFHVGDAPDYYPKDMPPGDETSRMLRRRAIDHPTSPSGVASKYLVEHDGDAPLGEISEATHIPVAKLETLGKAHGVFEILGEGENRRLRSPSLAESIAADPNHPKTA